jgi:hypothetical protein
MLDETFSLSNSVVITRFALCLQLLEAPQAFDRSSAPSTDFECNSWHKAANPDVS